MYRTDANECDKKNLKKGVIDKVQPLIKSGLYSNYFGTGIASTH